MTGCKGLFANSQRPRNKAQQAWSAPFSHHNPDLIHHMSPWVTILELGFIAPHFPQPAHPPEAFLYFCARPRKLSHSCGWHSLYFIISSPRAVSSPNWGPCLPGPWTVYLLTDNVANMQHSRIKTLSTTLKDSLLINILRVKVNKKNQRKDLWPKLWKQS